MESESFRFGSIGTETDLHPRYHTTSYPISSFLSYDKFDDSHRNFLLSISTVTAPKTFQEAILLDEFKVSMKAEMNSLEDTGTWSLCQLPPGKNPVGCKWVNTYKFNPDGTVERPKSLLIAKGNLNQLNQIKLVITLIIEEDINNREKIGLGAVLVDQGAKKWGVFLKRSEMNGSWNYGLVCGWNDVVKANGLKDGDSISLWSFRCR